MADDKPQRADSRRNREQILDAAAVIMAREPKPTLALIATEAGISRATVYRHFSDLETIREALFEEVTDVARDIVEKHLTTESDATFPDRVVATVRDALPIRTRYSEAMAREPVADAGALAAFTPIAAALIKQAQSQSEVRRDIDPVLMAEALITVAFYAARRVHRDGVPVDEAMHIIEVMMRGMATRPRAGTGL